MKFLVITGLSGAGKSQAVNFLEDLGFFCVDNLPPTLIPKFAEILIHSDGKINEIAIVVDIRGGAFFDSLFESLAILKKMGLEYDILFLDAKDEVLIKRFKESRRKHPLSGGGSIIEGIKRERSRLQKLKEKATYIIDTSNIRPRELKDEIAAMLGDDNKYNDITISIISFGFKYGIPLDSDLVFDVRFIPNPFYVESLKELTGRDMDVMDYVMKWKQTSKFIELMEEMLDFLIPQYVIEGKNQLVISIGCTGGKHRSVSIAHNQFEKLKKKGYRVDINHRDISDD